MGQTDQSNNFIIYNISLYYDIIIIMFMKCQACFLFLDPQNEVGPSISSSIFLCSFVLCSILQCLFWYSISVHSLYMLQPLFLVLFYFLYYVLCSRFLYIDYFLYLIVLFQVSVSKKRTDTQNVATNLYKLMIKPRVNQCTEIKMRAKRDKITGPVEMRTAVQIDRVRLEKCIRTYKTE